MRYDLNEVVPVVAMLFKNEEYTRALMFSSYYPWSDRVVSEYKFLNLTVMEHHRVRNEWAEADSEPTCDGFILCDTDGNVFHNQYPVASYGQTSDTCDRLFDRAFDKGEFEPWLNVNHYVPCEYRMLSDYLRSVKRGIWQRQQPEAVARYTDKDKEHTLLLEKHLEEIIAAYEKHSGNKVVFDKHMISERVADGDTPACSSEWLEGWWDVSFSKQPQ